MSTRVVPAIDRKLLREVSRLKGQIATIALVLAGGMTCFIGLRGTSDSLETSRDAYYDRFRFAHVFAHLERAPESIARRIEALPGVETLQTRIAEDVSIPIEGMDRAASGRLLSLPPSGEPATNALYLREGSFPTPGRDEVVVLESFATAHGLRPGDHLPVVLNGKLRQLRIVGLALCPEFVYAIRPGALADDPSRNGVLWMERSVLAAAFELEGAFDDVTVRLQPEASERATLDAVDRILAPYGGTGAVGRKDQISNRILVSELEQLRSLASMVPSVFLAVAAFLVNMVLGRLIANQRGEIAVLKAIGYTNLEVTRHYLWLVAVVMVPGGLLGVLGGVALGHFVLGLYAGIFRFPSLEFGISSPLVASAMSLGALSAIVGALLAVRAAASLPPAEAMRPPAPARYRRGILGRLGIEAFLGSSTTMVLREIGRKPLRTMLSAVGMGGAIALIVFGSCGSDALDYYLDSTFRREQRQDLGVTFTRPVEPRVVRELGRLPGVLKAEAVRAVPIRVRHENRMRDSVLMGLPHEATLRHLVARGAGEVPLPDQGVLVTRTLADLLGLSVGDRAELELREGDRRVVRPVIAGLVDEAVGLQLYATDDVAAALSGDHGAASMALLRVDPSRRVDVERQLRNSPAVLDVSDVNADIDRMRAMNGEAMDVWTWVAMTLSALIVFGVVYNNARIALATGSRDLATLRVLGMTLGEISAILIGGLAVQVAIAIPLGLVMGKAFAAYFFATTIDQETFRFQAVIDDRTYVRAAVVALVAAAASALSVRQALGRLDLIGVLKTKD
ncbi:MAG TPA: ABC transporter permease [Polyangiaceae bacterium]|nr:ABC transporter permease [Polyangiaceae bacterium]